MVGIFTGLWNLMLETVQSGVQLSVGGVCWTDYQWCSDTSFIKSSAKSRKNCQRQLTNNPHSSLFYSWRVFPFSLSFSRGEVDLESEIQRFSVCKQLVFVQDAQIKLACRRLSQPAFWGVSSITLERRSAGSNTECADRACSWRAGGRYHMLYVATKPGSRGGCNWCRGFS